MNFNEEVIREELRKYGQEHLLKFWNELSDEEKETLLSDIGSINVKEAVEFFESVKQEHLNHQKLDTRMEPVPEELHGSINRTELSHLDEYEDEGFRQISEGCVGVLLLAGGQGTRLGSADPKGMYNVKLPSQKSLFQIQAERILKLQSLAGERHSKSCCIPWYIMTSSATTEKTEEFLKKHQYFGLNENDVIIFEQGMLPCFDFDGKILVESKYKIAKAPDGNGGLYKALKKNKVLEDMEKRHVKYLHVYCVDNILVKVADPVFIGYCVKKQADCGAKVVEKKSPEEAIGVVCMVDGKLQVVEYSEITKETANKKNSAGRLMFNAGNICNHFFTLEFLKEFACHNLKKMKLHRAEKKISYIDSEGKFINPEKPNGVKIEKFVFDIFPFAKNFVIWEVNRNEEFSPLKNSCASKEDNPETAKTAISNLHKKFIHKAGGKILCEGAFEISPLVSYAGEGLASWKDKVIDTNYIASTAEKKVCIQNGYH